MKKRKNQQNSHTNKNVSSSSLHFELEENALELMEEHLALFKPCVKDADRGARQESPRQPVRHTVEIDLHGLTLEEAERWVMNAIDRVAPSRDKRTYKIITGKGRHSNAGRGVLIREIYLFVLHRYGPWIERIEESPDGVRLGGEAIRGHFHVTLKGP